MQTISLRAQSIRLNCKTVGAWHAVPPAGEKNQDRKMGSGISYYEKPVHRKLAARHAVPPVRHNNQAGK
jgi:hypothetical protein